ncbi:MAG: hypothetical protein AB8D78_02125 [Akkermansiaceae bacterium]
MMKGIYSILAVAFVMLIGCGEAPKDVDALFDSIEVGMSVEKVEGILGEPTSKIEDLTGYMMLWEMESGETIGVTVDDKGEVTSTSRG